MLNTNGNLLMSNTLFNNTHVTGAKAELFFCRYVEGTRRFFTHVMAVIVQETWADHFNPALVTVVDGVIVALVWEYDGSKHFAFFFRLDAHAEAPILKGGVVHRQCGDHPCA